MPGEFGYYWRGTRFLSQMELRLYGDPPVVLDADSVEDDTRLKIELTNGELRLRSFDTALKRVQEIVRRYVPEGVSLSEELIRERRAEAAREEGE